MSKQLLLGTRKGLFHVDRTPSGWKIGHVSFLADNVSMVLRDPRDGMLHAALDLGHFGVKMHRSTDNGRTWTENDTPPAYPERPEGEPEDKDTWGRPIPWKLVKVWSLEPGHVNEPGVLWCGTLPGGLFRSADSGKSWQLVTTLWNHPKRKVWFGGGADLPGIHSICVDPRDGKRVAVGVSCGGVWMTSDGGASWHCAAEGMRAEYMPPEQQMDPNIQDPHRVVQCPAQPEYFWAQHHNGIFRTTDGCVSWQEIKNAKPAAFGFAVVVHPRDPDTAWFVPGIKDEKRIPVDGKVVVSRTRDGGKSFEVLRKGLPQEHAYDLVYRHGLDIDESGERLAFGSTTGSCWISEDGGDSWQCLSSNLPPIYCVRFTQA